MSVNLKCGGTLRVSHDVHEFFLEWGSILLGVGIVGWLCFIVPAIARNLSR